MSSESQAIVRGAFVFNDWHKHKHKAADDSTESGSRQVHWKFTSQQQQQQAVGVEERRPL